MAIFDEKIEIREQCKGVHCVDPGESFQTHIYLQNFVSKNQKNIQQRLMKILEIRERCNGVHGVDLGDSFPTRVYLKDLASTQPRTSPNTDMGYH